SAKITNWDTAYSWGNHSAAGYLTTYTETDPIFTAHPTSDITASNITNWDTAYAWGDHASAGYSTTDSTGGWTNTSTKTTTALEVNTTAKIHTPELCLNSTCRTEWPEGSNNYYITNSFTGNATNNQTLNGNNINVTNKYIDNSTTNQYSTNNYYTIASNDTLDNVTSRGATTSNNITVGSLKSTGILDVEVSSGGAATIGSSDNSATGNYAIAMGYNTNASGDHSTAIGFNTTASGHYSKAMGISTTASGLGSVSTGFWSTASGGISTAIGEATTASGDYSTAMGSSASALGARSTAMGFSTVANGLGSTTMGEVTHADGQYSTAMGSYTQAQSAYSLVVGRYNQVSGDNTSWIPTDPIFIIGNGTSNGNRQNSITVLKNGKVGLGTTTPTQTLDVNGSINTTKTVYADSFAGNGSQLTGMFSGSYNDLSNRPTIPSALNDLTDVNTGTPSDGEVLKWNTDHWEADTDGGVGTSWSLLGNSVAGQGYYIGTNDNANFTIKVNNQRAFVILPATYPTIIGGNNAHSGTLTGATISGGRNNQISASYATIAGGRSNSASGLYSKIPGGYANVASGQYSFAAGTYSTAAHAGSFVWSDSDTTEVSSQADDQFVVKADGGAVFTRKTDYEGDLPAAGYIAVFMGSSGINGYVDNDGNWVPPSDRRIKKDITDIDYGLEAVMDLRPVSYKMKNGSNHTLLGLIAQEVEDVIPELVRYGNDHYGLVYDGFTPVLTKAIQEQQAEIESLQDQVDSLILYICNSNPAAEVCNT
ncbi:tail fiber domain-containing protein, partial [Nanoarchaeota archaeon]